MMAHLRPRWSQEEAGLRRRISEVTGISEDVIGRRRRWGLTLISLLCLGMLPWIGWLLVVLPPTYRADHWRLTWVGFDLFLFVMLSLTAYLAWLGRQLVVLTAFATAVLLACDAWFDVTTASPDDLGWAVAVALLVELPLALVLASLPLLALSAWAGAVRGEPLSLWRMPLLPTVRQEPPHEGSGGDAGGQEKRP